MSANKAQIRKAAGHEAAAIQQVTIWLVIFVGFNFLWI